MSTQVNAGQDHPATTAEVDDLVVTVVIPCLNEEQNIEQCVTTALG